MTAERIQKGLAILVGLFVLYTAATGPFEGLIQRALCLALVSALGFALYADSGVFGLVLMAWSALGSMFTPVLAVRLAGWRLPPGVAIAMMVSALVTVMVWRQTGLNGAVYELLPGALVPTLLYADLADGADVRFVSLHPNTRPGEDDVRWTGDGGIDVWASLNPILTLAKDGRFPWLAGDGCRYCDIRDACRKGHPPTATREANAEDRERVEAWSLRHQTDGAP